MKIERGNPWGAFGEDPANGWRRLREHEVVAVGLARPLQVSRTRAAEVHIWTNRRDVKARGKKTLTRDKSRTASTPFLGFKALFISYSTLGKTQYIK